MVKKIAGMLSVIAGLATAGAAMAAVPPATDAAAPVASYALSTPIPNAARTLKADDAAHAKTAGFEEAQVYFYAHHHHHHHRHHHRGFYIR